jgi:hypothetical protein
MSMPPHDDSYKEEEDFAHDDNFDHPLTHGHPPFQPNDPARCAAAHQPTAANEVPPRQLAAPRKTDHSYVDYSTHSPSPYQYPTTKKSDNNFPAKLHRLISDPANSEAIQWQPHGRGASSLGSCAPLLILCRCIANSSAVWFFQFGFEAWKVLDKSLLVEVVIPKYFVQVCYWLRYCASLCIITLLIIPLFRQSMSPLLDS